MYFYNAVDLKNCLKAIRGSEMQSVLRMIAVLCIKRSGNYEFLGKFNRLIVVIFSVPRSVHPSGVR